MCRIRLFTHCRCNGAGPRTLKGWLVTARAVGIALGILSYSEIGAAQTPQGLIALKQYSGCEILVEAPPCPSPTLAQGGR